MTDDEIQKAAEEWTNLHCWDVPTKGMVEREISCINAYKAGAAWERERWAHLWRLYRELLDSADIDAKVSGMIATRKQFDEKAVEK